ncbi:hypothetical protein AAG906_025876 [Vitis piasezkii]
MAPKSGRGKQRGDKKKKEEKGERPGLKDTVDVAALKPCVLTLVEEDYDEDTAAAHVRRVLDIVACTTCFGPSPCDAGKNAQGAQDRNSGNKSSKALANAKQSSSSSPPPTPSSANEGEER